MVPAINIANIVYKPKQGILPTVFKNYLIWIREFLDHVTHNANKLHIRQSINENGRTITNTREHISGINCLILKQSRLAF